MKKLQKYLPSPIFGYITLCDVLIRYITLRGVSEHTQCIGTLNDISEIDVIYQSISMYSKSRCDISRRLRCIYIILHNVSGLTWCIIGRWLIYSKSRHWEMYLKSKCNVSISFGMYPNSIKILRDFCHLEKNKECHVISS